MASIQIHKNNTILSYPIFQMGSNYSDCKFDWNQERRLGVHRGHTTWHVIIYIKICVIGLLTWFHLEYHFLLLPERIREKAWKVNEMVSKSSKKIWSAAAQQWDCQAWREAGTALIPSEQISATVQGTLANEIFVRKVQ